jgi:hypothetical protein
MPWGTLTFIGSGEFSPLMAKTYRRLLRGAERPVRAVFVDTPAGFELNVDQIAAKAQAYFARRLDLTLELASLRRADASPDEIAACAQALDRAGFVFAGPGSPTYAARVWQATGLAEHFLARLQAGAAVVFASAAAITTGRNALPVYEIYKVGQDPFWAEGIDLLGRLGLALAVVPHWNNAEGGTHDTAYCYMGAERFAALEAQLPAGTTVLGIDEYTACTLDFAHDEVEVSGSGQVTVRRAGHEQAHPSGSRFPLAELRGDGAPAQATRVARPDPPAATAPPAATERSAGVQAASERAERAERGGAASVAAPAAVSAPAGSTSPAPAGASEPAALVELLVRVRSDLRGGRQWELADKIRAELEGLGVEIHDGPDGTSWSWRAGP